MGPPPPPPLLLFSPSQLAYLHSSLSLRPPIRPDARTPTSFRSLRAEIDILPAANGSARVCFAEGGEAVVGIRAEVEPTVVRGVERGGQEEEVGGDDGWVEVAIELREDEAEGVFLAEMLREALLADGNLRGRLVIGRGWHWRVFVDVSLVWSGGLPINLFFFLEIFSWIFFVSLAIFSPSFVPLSLSLSLSASLVFISHYLKIFSSRAFFQFHPFCPAKSFGGSSN